jgi:diguanylate cyclase (GGDEF)-like protein/PAS domain S-box-containing protein
MMQLNDLQTLFNSLDYYSFILDQEGNITHANHLAQEKLAYTENEFAGMPFFNLFPKDRWEEVKVYLAAGKNGKVLVFCIPMLAKEGTLVALETRIVKMDRNGDGALLCVSVDRSEAEKTEEALRRAEIQLEHYASTILEFFWTLTTDLAGRILVQFISKGVENVTGFSPETFMAGEKDWYSLIHKEDMLLYKEGADKRIISGSTGEIVYRIVKADGTIRWVSDRIRSRRIVRNHIVLDGSVVDVTGQKQAELTMQQANDQLQQWVNELKQRTSEVVMLNEMGDFLQSCQNVENAYTIVGQSAIQLFPNHSGALYILNPETSMLELVTSWGKNPPVETGFTSDACWSLRRGQMQIVANAMQRIRCQHVTDDNEEIAYLCVPMIAQAETLGMLHIRGKAGEPIEHLKQLALMVTERVSLALSNLKLSETLRSQSIRDLLTGLFNRRYMYEMMEREIRRAARYNRFIGIIMIDIDHFKQFNDSFGHSAGDAILKELGRLMQIQFRGEDVACRFGGEEFMVMLTEASVNDTFKRADLLRKAVHEMHVRFGGRYLEGVSISVGVAGYPDHGRTANEVIEAADAALYCAKREGRNKVMVAKTREE